MKARLLIPITLLISFFCAVALCIFFYPKDDSSLDAELFAQEFTQVNQDNVFHIASIENVSTLLENGTNVIFFCYPSSNWCQTYASMLSNLAVKHNIDTIYYYDVVTNQEQNSEAHQNLINALSPHLQYDPSGVKRLYVPDAIFISDGEVIGNDWTTSVDTRGLDSPEAYWTSERIKTWEEKIGTYFNQLKH